MCLEEYDEAFHIASEKEISFEEGRIEGLKNAEKERLRAEIFRQKLRGKSEDAIAESQGITLDEVQKILDEI